MNICSNGPQQCPGKIRKPHFTFFPPNKQLTPFNCSPNLSRNDDKPNRHIGIESESVESTAIATTTTKRKNEFQMISNNQTDGLAAGHWHHVTGCDPPSNVTHSLIWLHGLGIVAFFSFWKYLQYIKIHGSVLTRFRRRSYWLLEISDITRINRKLVIECHSFDFLMAFSFKIWKLVCNKF